jgi:hypothetical protein
MNQESKDNFGGVNLVSVRTCPKSYIARDCSGEVARAITSRFVSTAQSLADIRVKTVRSNRR